MGPQHVVHPFAPGDGYGARARAQWRPARAVRTIFWLRLCPLRAGAGGRRPAYKAFGTSAYARAVYDHVLSLAVPSFFLISLFLFADKGQTGGRRLFRRIERLVLLFVFWSGLHVLIFRDTGPFADALHSITGFVRLAVKGGNAVFYFFSCLALMTLVASMACRLAPRLLWLLAVLSICGLWPMSALAGGNLSEEFANYYNPLNFLPYAFVAPVLASQVKAGSLRMSAVKASVVLGAVFLLFASVTLLEGRFLRTADGRVPAAYSQPSAVLGAVVVVLLALMVRRPAPWFVKRLSDFSLGIYCVHEFVKAAISDIVPAPHWQCLAVFGLSIVVVAFLRHALARQMI